jgi:hypothetical protein
VTEESAEYPAVRAEGSMHAKRHAETANERFERLCRADMEELVVPEQRENFRRAMAMVRQAAVEMPPASDSPPSAVMQPREAEGPPRAPHGPSAATLSGEIMHAAALDLLDLVIKALAGQTWSPEQTDRAESLARQIGASSARLRATEEAGDGR